MFVEKILAKPFENIDAQSTRRLIKELEEVRWALTTVRGLTKEDETGQLAKRFEQWLVRIDERRAHVMALYANQTEALMGASDGA